MSQPRPRRRRRTHTKAAAATKTFCAAFADLKSQRDSNGKAQTKDKAGWELDIASVNQIAALAPAAEVNNAKANVEMVKDRAAPAATYDYGAVPTEAMRSFAVSHTALQAQVNALVAYATSTCTGLT